MQGFGGVANSVDEWKQLADQQEAAALALLNGSQYGPLPWSLAGFAIECALKGAIMKKFGFNPDLYVHDLQCLAKILGMTISASDATAPSWSLVINWRREHMYNPNLPAIYTQQLCVAALDPTKGVKAWIYQNFL
jgi:hypothetical protein